MSETSDIHGTYRFVADFDLLDDKIVWTARVYENERLCGIPIGTIMLSDLDANDRRPSDAVRIAIAYAIDNGISVDR